MRGADLTGQLIDRRYKIEERIAEGAMGVVYRATRTKLDRAVAIKIMHTSLSAEDGRKRFEREAKLMARLEHPHCVSIIDFGLHDHKPFVVMELIRGRDLHEMLVEQGRFEVPKAVEIMTQILSGLAHAHDQGIIHRDIKPANIMISPKAPLGVHARILDFGLARMLGASTSLSDGMAVGTPSYMSPEQCRGDQVDQRVDIYACGVVLFEMLTGKKPFVAKEPFDIINKQLSEPPPKLVDVMPGDYGRLQSVVDRCLAKSAADRYPTAVAMAEALRSAAPAVREPTRDSHDSTSQIPLGDPERSGEVPIRRSVRARPSERKGGSSAGWIVLGMLVVGAAGAGGYIYWRDHLAGSAGPKSPGATPVAPPPLDAPAAAPVAVPDEARAPVPQDASAESPSAPGDAEARSTDAVDAIVENAKQLAAAGTPDKAIQILADARKVFPDRAELPALAGKLFFARLWWNDGIASFRAAFKIDPNLKSDREILELVVRGFLTTPAPDGRITALILEIGEPIGPVLDEVAASHPNPEKRARAAAMRKRIR